MQRFLKRAVAVVTLIGVLGLGIATPPPVQAVDTEDGLIMAGVAAAAYIALVVVSTTLIYGHYAPATTAPTVWEPANSGSDAGLNLANRCPQAGTSLNLVCW